MPFKELLMYFNVIQVIVTTLKLYGKSHEY
jgi:hypothetical protein